VSPVLTFDDADAVARAGAHEFVTLAAAAAAVRGRFTVALAGCRTPHPVQRVAPERDRLVWLLDRAAAGSPAPMTRS